MGSVGLCETYNEPACSACFGMYRRKTSDIPNAQVDGSQVVTEAAFDVNVLSSPGVRGGATQLILPILPFLSSPGVVTAKTMLRKENQQETLHRKIS